MSAEIVARLTVNAADLAPSINAGFAQITANAKANAAELGGAYSSTFKQLAGTAKREFAEAFREINNLASNAVSGGATGGVFDAGQMRAAATAARERAAGLQQFVTAAENASRSSAGLTTQERLYLVAAQASLRESVEEANALNLKAAALERLTGEMGQTVAAQGVVRVSSGQMKAGVQQLTFNLNDMATGFASGINPMTLFIQQGSQFVQAMTLMTNRTTGFIGFLGGPWFAGLTVAASVLYAFASSHDKAGESAEAHGRKEKSLTERIREQNEALQRNIELQGQRQQRDLASANSGFVLANNSVINQREAIQRKQAEIDAVLARGPNAGAGYSGLLRALRAELAGLNKELKTYEQNQRDAGEAVRAASIVITDRKISGAFDKMVAETNRYEDALGKLRNEITKTDGSQADYERGATALRAEHEKNKKAIDAATKAQRDSNSETEKAKTLARPATGQVLSAYGADRSGVPLNGARVAGRRHAGVDIVGNIGDPVVAPEGGIARVKNAPGGLGLYVEIKADSGARNLLAHLSKTSIADGSRVEAGQLVGLIGDSGNAKGGTPHLHWQRQVAGKWVDPMKNVGSRGAASVADDAVKAAQDRAEAFARIKGDLEKEGVLLAQNARMEELRAKEMDAQADKEQKLFELHSRYSALIAGNKNLTAEDRKELEKLLETTKQLTAADADRRAAAEAAKVANDNVKGLRADIDGDIAEERERQRLDAMRAAGLSQQAEKEYAIWQYRSRYHDLLAGEPAMAAKLLGITTEMVIAERARLKQSEELIAKGIADNQARDNINNLADFYERAFASGGKSIWQDFKAQGRAAIANLLAQWTIGMVSGNGQGVGGLLNSILGGGGAGGASGGGSVNAAVNSGALNKMLGLGGASGGGALGGAGPAAVAIGLNQMLSDLLGNKQIKNGSTLSLLIGPIATALFGSAKRGSATLGFSNGSLGVGSTRGNSGSRIDAAEGGIDSLVEMLESIAEQVGGTITGAGSVSIGVRKKKYVVDPTGRGRTKGAGVLSFADEKEAVMAALKDALSDGVIAGISAASQRIIQSGQDLQKAMQKVLLIEAIPKALKSRFDPVGAALDALNEKWDKTVAALKEGAATAEQFADASKLYKLERADILAAANDNLKDFINGLNFGPNSTYSLGDQAVSARQQVDPYLAMIRSGNFAGVDQDKYLSGASDFLAIQRQIGGSGPEWFAAVDEFRTATQTLADGLSAKADARDVFAELTASASQATAGNTQATADILALQSTTLANIEEQLRRLNLDSANGFIGGADRSFVALR